MRERTVTWPGKGPEGNWKRTEPARHGHYWKVGSERKQDKGQVPVRVRQGVLGLEKLLKNGPEARVQRSLQMGASSPNPYVKTTPPAAMLQMPDFPGGHRRGRKATFPQTRGHARPGCAAAPMRSILGKFGSKTNLPPGNSPKTPQTLNCSLTSHLRLVYICVHTEVCTDQMLRKPRN